MKTHQPDIKTNWKWHKLADCGHIQSGGTPDTKKQNFWNGSIPWITPSEVTELSEKFVYDTERYLTKEGLKHSSASLLPPYSLIICTRATVGNTCINAVPMCTNQGFKTLIPNHENNVIFLYYLVEYKKKEIIRKACGSTFLEISKKDISNISVLIPPITEQQKIVEVLETWDKAIQLTRKLIEQKELQKKYLMQQLLTGRTRLKGFSNKWGSYKLQELSKIHKGKQLNSTELTATGEYPCLNGGITPSGYTHNWNSEKNTISISEGGNSCGYVNWNPKRFWAGGHCYTLSELKADPEFLYFLLKYKEKYIMSLRVGSGLPNIQRNSLENLILYVPNNREEQSRIGRLLVGVDLGGELLQKRLAQLEEQKKGLMQILLTGKVRLNW